jgi:hypothetical protein
MLSPGVGNGLGRTKSQTKEKMITKSNGDSILPSRSPRETKKGRDRKLPILSLDMFRV